MIERRTREYDVCEQISSAVEQLSRRGLKASKLPGMAVDALGNLLKGRGKMAIEITGYEEPLNRIEEIVRYLTLVLVACVVFGGSCILCTTSITPQIQGIPLVGFVGLLFSTALGIFAVARMMRAGKK